uniref:Craniofacial development protein 2-like n=1 Tax=Nicotiana tabacum TaxID=4097 RepID=A0A1S4C963_TOBAC|nr:PREDICTED: craniofacial development protein 2-like [Nicotiana tabacum]
MASHLQDKGRICEAKQPSKFHIYGKWAAFAVVQKHKKEPQKRRGAHLRSAGRKSGIALAIKASQRRVKDIISAYAPQAGLDEEVKRHFWEDLHEMVHSIPHTEKLFIGGDFNGHIRATSRGYDDVHGGFGFGDRNKGGTSLLDFARAFDLVIANSSFPKKREHLVTFRSSVAKTQIDYLLCRKSDRGLCTKAKAQELGVHPVTIGAWRSSGDASDTWTTTAQCIREAASEVLGVSKGYYGVHKGDWGWNGEVQEKWKPRKQCI